MVYRLLLVEDNDLNRDMLSRRLKKKGFEVIIAVDGAEGVEKTLSDQPDLVIMDMSLPILDGWEATRKIKSSLKAKTIPILGLSAHAMIQEKEEALNAGCDDYDTKPIDFPRLLEKIETLLKKAS